MNADYSSSVPNASPAMLALATAWMACVDDLHVCDPPRFSIDGSNVLDIAEAADLLKDRPKPIWLTPVQLSDVLAVSTTQTPTPALQANRPFSRVLLTEGPADERRVLVVAGRARFRASPADVEAASSQYCVVAAASAAVDHADSGFVDGLGLLPSELRDVAEVLVLGRATEQGWVLPVVPSVPDNETP